MNSHDKDNLNFILSLNETQFDEWYGSLSQDDIEYAMEILRAARTEVALQIAELHDETEDLDLANEVLAKFRLTK